MCFTNCVNTHSCRWRASLLRTMWIWSGAARSENATTKAAPALHTDEGSRSQVLVCASGKHVGWQTPTLLTAEARRHAENSISPSAPLPEFDPSALSRRADCQEFSRKLTHDGNKAVYVEQGVLSHIEWCAKFINFWTDTAWPREKPHYLGTGGRDMHERKKSLVWTAVCALNLLVNYFHVVGSLFISFLSSGR